MTDPWKIVQAIGRFMDAVIFLALIGALVCMSGAVVVYLWLTLGALYTLLGIAGMALFTIWGVYTLETRE